MSGNIAPRRSVADPAGDRVTVESLPPRATTRWVARRKAQVVAAVKSGLLTVDEVCERYALSIEEYASWQRALERSGLAGLRITKLQSYRAS